MKVVCAPDSFKESLSAVDAANAMAQGIRRAVADAEINICPIGDGGEGTLEALLYSVDGDRVTTRVSDVFGRKIDTVLGLVDGGRTAFIESAAAIGLSLIPAAERNVMQSSSFGVGELILGAAARTPGKIIVGIGGSATNDGGCGMAQALGVRFYDGADNLICHPISGGMLSDIGRIDIAHRAKQLLGFHIVVAGDVRNPLTGSAGAARVYAPQKGATPDQVADLDAGLEQLANLIRRDLDIDIASTSGAGAAGGLGAGLMAFAGAQMVSGIDTLLDAVKFDQRMKDADLCLTGEGRLDKQSTYGKACVGVAGSAATHNVPVVALVGGTGPGAGKAVDFGVTDYAVIGEGLSTDQSIQRAAELLADAAAAAVAKYS